MKYWIIATCIFVALISFALGTEYSTYQYAYDRGYLDGYQYAQSLYPSMNINGFSYMSDNSTIAIGMINIQGEQRILDAVQQMPNIIIEEKTGNNWSLKLATENSPTIISKSELD